MRNVPRPKKRRRLLEELPEDAPVPLLRALEHVAAGVERMDAALREAAQQTLDSAAADREQSEHDAAALVLQESLRDLGYEVEDIEATLFVDGGAVHFRRAGWDNYFVRLRAESARAHGQLQRGARAAATRTRPSEGASMRSPRIAGAPSFRGCCKRWRRADSIST